MEKFVTALFSYIILIMDNVLLIYEQLIFKKWRVYLTCYVINFSIDDTAMDKLKL